MRLADPVALYRSELALGRGTTPMMGELLLNLAVPCALIEGEHTAEHTDDPALRAAGIPVLVVADAGHTMMIDNPTGFAHAIAHALTDLTT
jgi:pimeloyl-ACP methyl ester carboxylesterase